NAPRAGIEPQALVEAAFLRATVDLADDVAAPEREAASAQAPRRLEDDAVVAGAIELVGRREPGDAGAEDDHAAAGAGILRQAEARGLCRRRLQEVPGRERLVGGPCPAQAGHGADELASRERHGGLHRSNGIGIEA